ncbi:hypothetical protein GCM10007862_15720 [Dyella lipolytica]|uniref:Uncharacterized protein n=1 Tax=Dyella lipolytica TaxID=1867835 RepID=A0ABW8ITJ3_9GAMM|nr:hypothetical protein [Dyella lipolytica]GLQ46521.1 hypothetical protein GCM10007862_15720 [Dyella lipolytica]
MKRKAILFLLVSAINFSTAFALQQPSDTVPAVTVSDNAAQFRWRQLDWSIPNYFFYWFREYTTGDKEVLLHIGYQASNGTFVNASHEKYDILLNVHIRPVDNEDPRNALALIHRIGLPFDQVPEFTSAKFPGMTYLGSSSSFHYFKLANEDAYVECHLLTADRLSPPKVSHDVLSKEFVCGTAFGLPAGLYAWIDAPGVHIDDVAKAFLMVRAEVVSFIR